MNKDICRGIYALIRKHLNEILALRGTATLKEDNSFVSKGDLFCDSLIKNYVKEHLHNAHIISEESKESWNIPTDVEYVVTIDPIDGTENFISGLKEWGVGICIYRNGLHYQSMIALPELNTCLVTGDKLERIQRSRLCGLPSYMKPEHFEMLGRDYEYRQLGCCMMNMYNVIKGSFVKFVHVTGCYSWDILPGMNLAIEHGLNVEINGKKYAGEFLLPGIKYRFIVGK